MRKELVAMSKRKQLICTERERPAESESTSAERERKRKVDNIDRRKL